MEQTKIKKRFYMGFILIPLISLIGAKLLYIFASITASDIFYTGSSSFFLRFLPYLCKYGYIVLDQLFIGAGIASIIYAVTYFGCKTAVKALLSSVAAYMAAFILELIYNLLRNSLSAGQITAALIAMISELLFTVAFFVLAIVAASLFLKKSFTSRKRNRLKAYSVYRAALVPIGVSAIIRILDITIFNVIPFLIEYDDIRPDEIVDIVIDYAYSLALNFVLAYLLCIITLRLYKAFTGALKPKYTGVSK